MPLFACILEASSIASSFLTATHADRLAPAASSCRKWKRAWRAVGLRLGLHFVGDWHSHPENLPEPSFTDLASVRECFQQSLHDLKALLLVVVGRRAGSAGLWVGLVTRHTVRRLHPEQTINAPIHANSAGDTTKETAP